jgi:hypothetical protein
LSEQKRGRTHAFAGDTDEMRFLEIHSVPGAIRIGTLEPH